MGGRLGGRGRLSVGQASGRTSWPSSSLSGSPGAAPEMYSGGDSGKHQWGWGSKTGKERQPVKAGGEWSFVPRGPPGSHVGYTHPRARSQGEGAELFMPHPVIAGGLLVLGLRGIPEHFLLALQRKAWPAVASQGVLSRETLVPATEAHGGGKAQRIWCKHPA